MNAIPPDEAFTQQAAGKIAQYLVMLQKLAELGMQLAERAAADALASPSQADPAQRPPRKRPDPTLLFLRLSKAVRDTIAMEARIAAGHPPAPARAKSAPPDDPRRAAIRAFMHQVIDTAAVPPPVKASSRQKLEGLISQAMEVDPVHAYPDGSVVMAICEALGLTCDVSEMPRGFFETPAPGHKAALSAGPERKAPALPAQTRPVA